MSDAPCSCCASCGKAEIDDFKLMPCDGCDLVRYCDEACQELHRPEHAGKCRKRAAELHDKLLFKQPESSHMGDCPICSIPLSLDISKSNMYNCCSKFICDGCRYANAMREFEASLQSSCPFCRSVLPDTQEERDQQLMKRVEMNDPVAMRQEGGLQEKKGNYASAFEYFTKAAKLGDAQAHYRLAGMYHDGEGVEMDKEKYTRHLEEAAIGGHPNARYNLGCEEQENGNIARAVKHWIIAATQGDDNAMKNLLIAFKQGVTEKDVLAATLRAQKAAVDATKSPQRKAAEDFFRMKRLLQNQNSLT